MDNYHKKTVGHSGEKLASEYLKKHGYTIVEINWTCRYGEIDIIAIDKDTLVFVEVKTRYSDIYGLPEESITPWKLKSVIKAASYYCVQHPNMPEALRIDFVGIEYDKSRLKRINLIKSITE